MNPFKEVSEVAIDFVQLTFRLLLPGLTSAIVGATRPEQVRDNAAASGVDLDAQTLAEIVTQVRQVDELGGQDLAFAVQDFIAFARKLKLVFYTQQVAAGGRNINAGHSGPYGKA